MSEARLEALLKNFRDSNDLVVILTGAGISAESGIPTFRGEEGYWKVGSRNYRPEHMATWSNFCRMPEDVWAWYLYRLGVCRNAQPNAAHHAVVKLERALGDRMILITQNVDGLHLRAGSSRERTYQIHGNIEFMRCAKGCHSDLYPIPKTVSCKQKGQTLSEEEVEALHCPRCGSRARPHVLWFDECYDEQFFRFQSSLTAARRCSLLIVVGTSGQTNLPTQVGQLAAQNNAGIIDINPMANPFSRLAESYGGVWVEGSAAQRLPELVDRLC
ncbi:MAG: RNA polymerase subunit sigma [Proteobacteria bacterium]|nr:RNA polymerase subunit sigma [Pseudomonadota bacterium]